MAFFLILILFFLPLATLYFSIANVKARGKNDLPIILLAVALWFLTLLGAASLNVSKITSEIVAMLAMICVCAAVFAISKIG